MENKDLICKNCIKEDVCDQKDIFSNIVDSTNRIYVGKAVPNSDLEGIMHMEEINRKYGIRVEVICTRAVKKQTEFSPGWTTANTKNL